MFQRCQMSDLWAEPRRTQPRPLMRATKSWCKGQDESRGPPATHSLHLSFSPPDGWRMLTDTSGDVSGDQTDKQRTTVHICVSTFVSETPLDLVTVNLELTANKTEYFPWQVSSRVCGDYNKMISKAYNFMGFRTLFGPSIIQVLGQPPPTVSSNASFHPCLHYLSQSVGSCDMKRRLKNSKMSKGKLYYRPIHI